jgi:hypothetical protein
MRNAVETHRVQRAALAQLVEHVIRNDGVGCSSHPSGTKFFSALRVSLLLKSSQNTLDGP